MQNSNLILLPGLSEQLNFLLNKINILNLNILIIGNGSIPIANKLSTKCEYDIEVIVEDYNSYIESEIQLVKNKNIHLKLMDFEHTDFSGSQFDLVYAQASISNLRRNKIIKEIKRILKIGGILCVGEITIITNPIPIFIQDIFNNSNLAPLSLQEIEKYYVEKNFELIDRQNLSSSLKKYYNILSEKSKTNIVSLNQNEKSFYKKLINQVKHESNAYLKLGADKYMGFETLLLKKK